MKQFLKKMLLLTNRTIISYKHPLVKVKDFKLIRKINNEGNLLLWDYEAYQLYVIVRDLCKKYNCNLAEVGVYKGGSAKVICEAKGSNKLYLFDTFNGLPKTEEIDKDNGFKEGDYNSSEDEVKKYLKGYENVKFVSGLFPDSANNETKGLKFMFVHLDVDLYKSTYESLSFFYPRMETGGIILLHDYFAENIKQSIHDFLNDKPEIIIELNGFQAMIIKQ